MSRFLCLLMALASLIGARPAVALVLISHTAPELVEDEPIRIMAVIRAGPRDPAPYRPAVLWRSGDGALKRVDMKPDSSSKDLFRAVLSPLKANASFQYRIAVGDEDALVDSYFWPGKNELQSVTVKARRKTAPPMAPTPLVAPAPAPATLPTNASPSAPSAIPGAVATPPPRLDEQAPAHIKAPERRPAQSTVVGEPGETAADAGTNQDQQSPKEPSVRPAAPPLPADAMLPQPEPRHRGLTYLTVGAGVVASGLGAYFGLQARAQAADARVGTADELGNSLAKAQGSASAANASWVAAGVLLVSGGVLWATDF